MFLRTLRCNTHSGRQARRLLECLGVIGGMCLYVACDRGRSGVPNTQIALPEHLEIEVRGKNRRWTARYPGADGMIQTEDDVLSAGKVYVPVGVPVTLHLRSDDFVYMFSLPHANLETIAVPDLEYQLEMTAAKKGSYKLEGGTMCGRPNTNHGTFAALTKDEFLNWHAASTK